MSDAVLMGWDAAWTPNGSGAWAVIRNGQMFVETCPKGEKLLEELDRKLEKIQPDLIAMDFPLAKNGVNGWREADASTTRTFSKYGCPVHSPNPDRPGRWGDQIVHIMKRHGYVLGVEKSLPKKAFIEVYPHTVLLEMYRLQYRYPYKVGRSAGYWPELNLQQLRGRLVERYQKLWRELSNGAIPFPALSECPNTAALKAVEDQIDALLCIRAAQGVLKGSYLPFGDKFAAIWNPDPLTLPEARRP